jgi:hypothetical protein
VILSLLIALSAVSSQLKFLQRGEELPALQNVITKFVSIFSGNNSNSSNSTNSTSNSTWTNRTNYTSPTWRSQYNGYYIPQNSSNSSNFTNGTTTRYTLFRRYENNQFTTYINQSNSSNTTNSTSTYIFTRNIDYENELFLFNQTSDFNYFIHNDQNFVRNITNENGTFIFIDFFTDTTQLHGFTGVEPVNQTSYTRMTNFNYTQGNTKYFSERNFTHKISVYNNQSNSSNNSNFNNTPYFPRNNNSNYSNNSNFNNTPYFPSNNYSNYSNYSNFNNTPYYPRNNYSNYTPSYARYGNSSNSSNTTNDTVIVESFLNFDNNYFRKYYNYSNTYWLPCSYEAQAYCVNNTVNFYNYTTQNQYYNGSSLVLNLTHYYIKDNYVSVYYNPWYGLPFYDVWFPTSSIVDNQWDVIYTGGN